jgi:hypothetical protein
MREESPDNIGHSTPEKEVFVRVQKQRRKKQPVEVENGETRLR